jgi:hypothetical protein
MNNYYFAGFISPEEFMRRRMHEQGDIRWEEELAKLRQQQRASRPQPKRKRKMNSTKKGTQPRGSAPTSQPQWENKLNNLKWKAIYELKEVQLLRNYGLNELTVNVPGFHRQTYSMDKIIHDYITYRRRKGDDWADIRYGDVATGKDLSLLFQWMLDTGLFPYPYEVAVGVRPHYIDMKPLI